MWPSSATENEDSTPVPSLLSFLSGLFLLNSDFVWDFGVAFLVLLSCFRCYFGVVFF